MNARKLGYTDVVLHYSVPAIPYSISGYTHENEERMLIYSLDRTQTFGYLSRHSNLRQLELFLKDGRGNLKYRYIYICNEMDYRDTTYEKILDQFPVYASYFVQDDFDNIRENEVKFFVFAAEEQWGFVVVPVRRANDILQIGKEAFYAFENDSWEMDFFDGTK